MLFALALTASLALSFVPAALAAAPCEQSGPSDAFCVKPPVVPVFDLPSYMGTWYQLFVSGSAAQFSTGPCVTANYTLRADGNVDVLNCIAREGIGAQPSCARATASPRENATEDAELSVSFPAAPPGPGNPGRYSVAALLGSAEDMYYAAAVYQCQSLESGNAPGFFILSRCPGNANGVLEELKKKLRGRGYDVGAEEFIFTPHEGCSYFFDEGGFEIFSGIPDGVDLGSGGGPPPGVDIGAGGGPPPGVDIGAGGGPPPGVL